LKVLHIDRNNYYGGDAASLNLTNLFKKFRNGADAPNDLGANRDYNIDLVPKFIMACGNLVKILIHTQVTRYLEFKSIDGSFVMKDNKLFKVPATPDEAVRTSLMGIFEKRRFRNLLVYVSKYVENDASTHDGLDLARITTSQLYAKFGVDTNTQSFTGHAMALHTSDEYLNEPAINTVRAIQLYVYSLERYGNSPYIYPLYGLGGLPEGFSRLCAIHGGTFMLNCNFDEVLTDEDGVAWGVRAGNQMAKARMVIGDPSYFPAAKTRSVGRTIRSICLLNHPIPNTKNGSTERESVQIILPAQQTRRKNDIYVCSVSFAHCVAPKGVWVAIVSTTVETNDPVSEVAPGINLLGPIMERFDDVSDMLEPVEDGTTDRCFISKSYDAASHFETCAADVLDLYARVTGEQLDMNISSEIAQE